MAKQNICGSIKIKASELNLDLTLLGGQSFRWHKIPGKQDEKKDIDTTSKWCGVAYETYWELTQQAECVDFVARPVAAKKSSVEDLTDLLQSYLRCDFNLAKHIEQWQQSHTHFADIAKKMSAVRILDQEPFENIISFICSQNNHIKRISTMIQWLCLNYGQKIGNFNGTDEYTFPLLETLHAQGKQLESELRSAKFGYRSKFIVGVIEHITANGGAAWLKELRQLPYQEARVQLVSLPGIGYKVADCICLMSLGHLQAVPVDTHIFKTAQNVYMPHLINVKTVTPKIYTEIAEHFQHVYGKNAGWAQAVLFCASLQKFQDDKNAPPAKKNRKK